MAVRREPNGQNLYWIQDGEKVTVNMMEGQAFFVAQETQSAQIEAKAENNRRRDNYMTSLNNQQISVDASRPYSVPVPPMQVVVEDPVMDIYGIVTPGEQYEQTWMPPLPQLKLKS